MPPLPVGPMAPVHPCEPPTPFFSWAKIPTSFHGARKDAVFSDAEVERLAKYQVVAVEKWYTPCGAQGPTQAGPSCEVEVKMATLFNRTRVLSPNQTTIMYWNSMFDFSMYKVPVRVEQRAPRPSLTRPGPARAAFLPPLGRKKPTPSCAPVLQQQTSALFSSNARTCPLVHQP